jgi:hypothetical protein
MGIVKRSKCSGRGLFKVTEKARFHASSWGHDHDLRIDSREVVGIKSCESQLAKTDSRGIVAGLDLPFWADRL